MGSVEISEEAKSAFQDVIERKSSYAVLKFNDSDSEIVVAKAGANDDATFAEMKAAVSTSSVNYIVYRCNIVNEGMTIRTVLLTSFVDEKNSFKLRIKANTEFDWLKKELTGARQYEPDLCKSYEALTEELFTEYLASRIA